MMLVLLLLRVLLVVMVVVVLVVVMVNMISSCRRYTQTHGSDDETRTLLVRNVKDTLHERFDTVVCVKSDIYMSSSRKGDYTDLGKFVAAVLEFIDQQVHKFELLLKVDRAFTTRRVQDETNI